MVSRWSARTPGRRLSIAPSRTGIRPSCWIGCSRGTSTVWTVLAALRGRGIDAPVLILSALSAVDERVRGLRAGGDDYLTKPFESLELTARIEVLLRRGSAEERETLLKVGDLEVDLITRRVWRGADTVELLPREYLLLEYLMRHAGQVITRTMLFEHVWQYRYEPRTNVIDVHMGKLRRKLDEGGLRR